MIGCLIIRPSRRFEKQKDSGRIKLSFRIIPVIRKLTGASADHFFNSSVSAPGKRAFDLSQGGACAFCLIEMQFLRFTALSV
jgi:hypothetical protein